LGSEKFDSGPIREIKNILKIDRIHALKAWSFCIEMVRVLKKNPENKICS
jgi:hypothetical protein